MTLKIETQTCSNCKKVLPTQVLSNCQICNKLVCQAICMKSTLAHKEFALCPDDFKKLEPILMSYQNKFTEFSKNIAHTFNRIVEANFQNMPQLNSLEDFFLIGWTKEDFKRFDEEIAGFYICIADPSELLLFPNIPFSYNYLVGKSDLKFQLLSQ